MAEMTVAAAAADLGTYHPVAVIFDVADMVGVERLEETRPAGPGLKLGRGVKQRQPTKTTGIDAFSLVTQQRPAERPFRGALQQDAALIHTQVSGEPLALGRTERTEIIS